MESEMRARSLHNAISRWLHEHVNNFKPTLYNRILVYSAADFTFSNAIVSVSNKTFVVVTAAL
jgi:hypothetical protein